MVQLLSRCCNTSREINGAALAALFRTCFPAVAVLYPDVLHVYLCQRKAQAKPNKHKIAQLAVLRGRSL